MVDYTVFIELRVAETESVFGLQRLNAISLIIV